MTWIQWADRILGWVNTAGMVTGLLIGGRHIRGHR